MHWLASFTYSSNGLIEAVAFKTDHGVRSSTVAGASEVRTIERGLDTHIHIEGG